MAQRLRPVLGCLGVAAFLALRVGASAGSPGGGVPWWVRAEELALGAVVYVTGLLAIAAPFIAVGVAREAYRLRRVAPLPRAVKRYCVGVCVACLALTTTYFGLMARYGRSPGPVERYRLEHGVR